MRKADERIELEYSAIRLEQVRRTIPGREWELAGEASSPARIIKTTFQSKEERALITNRGPEHRAAEIKVLYRKRRLLEQKYHTLKNKMKFESVTGKSGIYVRQDYCWAQTLVFTMVQDMISGAEKRRRRQGKRSNSGMRPE